MYGPTIRKAAESASMAPISKVAKPVYNRTLRPFLPRKTVNYNGVMVADRRLFDITGDDSEYEGDLILGLKDVLTSGDEVVIVGGGLGVSATVAAQIVGPFGSVEVFEAGNSQVSRVRDTLRRNAVSDRVTITQAVVGEAIFVSDRNGIHPPTGVTKINPDELPDCDVLELDCEGAERLILEELSIRPRHIVVEYHDCFDAPESVVRQQLIELDYAISAHYDTSEGEGIGILVAEMK